MRTVTTAAGLALLLLLALPVRLAAQAAETLGTRAQGMAGAFVGMADDASAVYWNPAGLAGGAYFSLVLDGNRADAERESGQQGAERSGWIVALTTPALGLGYYRLQTTVATPAFGVDGFRLDTLTTHHAGVTLVQSITDRLAVGGTVKVVRGFAGAGVVPAETLSSALDDWDVVGRKESQVDVDLGVMLTGSFGRIGLLARNLAEPSFDTGAGNELQLDRQIRAGASVFLLQNWKLAADLDLIRHQDAWGDVRELALGTEGQVTRRLAARGGLRLNTTGDHGRTPSFAVGASYAVMGSLFLDGQATVGSDEAFRGWGLAARMLF
jgi:hypothetical protein